MFLICGLGNPGKKYTDTRHNIGFKLVDKIVSHFDLKKIKEDKIKKLFLGEINNFKVLVLKRNYITSFQAFFKTILYK